MPKKKTATFEENSKRLDEIIALIEDGDIPLNDALDLYAEGAALAADCAKTLTAVRERVTVLTRMINGSFSEAEFDEGED